MKLFWKTLVHVHDGVIFLFEQAWASVLKRCMKRCGRNVMIKPFSSVFKGLENISISNDVRIARYAVVYSTEAQVCIGAKTGIAPYLKIISGNHRTDILGHFIFDADYEKSPKDDCDVVIEGDSWIGINVTILSGVRLGRGTVVAAGAVVTHSMPPYSIVGGIPAKVLRQRFTIDQILTHEKHLYSPTERYTRSQLIAFGLH